MEDSICLVCSPDPLYMSIWYINHELPFASHQGSRRRHHEVVSVEYTQIQLKRTDSGPLLLVQRLYQP